MKITVLYDSFFGNTERIAKAVAKAIKNKGNSVLLLQISEAGWETLSESEVIIFGSPTRGFRASPLTIGLLKKISVNGLENIKVAVFDTRLSLHEIDSKALRFIVKTGGYAAKQMSGIIQKKKGKLLVKPEGFLVSGEEGPLVDGELERAEQWANKILISALK